MKKIKKQKSKIKKYPAHYLGVALACLLLAEGILFTISSAQDWRYGFAIFDMSEAVVEVTQDLQEAIGPQVAFYHGVTDFYMAAADEITPMLDLTESAESVAQVWHGVSQFYEQASLELAQLLDVSDHWSQSRISGALIDAESETHQ